MLETTKGMYWWYTYVRHLDCVDYCFLWPVDKWYLVRLYLIKNQNVVSQDTDRDHEQHKVASIGKNLGIQGEV